MSMYPEEFIEDVRLQNDIVEVVSEYVNLERKGARYFGLCPFHNEKTPSFNVEPVKQYFYCFACNKGGNVFHFIMEIENFNFIEALKFLADRKGILLPEPNERIEKEKTELRREVIDVNREAARYFFGNLIKPESEDARNYLKKRGLKESTVKHFGLGYAADRWDALFLHLKEKGFSLKAIEASGLIIKTRKESYIDRFRGRIMFPIFDLRGNVVGFGGRAVNKAEPKYMNSPETVVYSKKRELYGLNFAKRSSSKKLLLVEGYMDVIMLYQGGIDFAIATLGTALTQEQGRILKKYSEETIICFDSDTAGQNATMRGLDILSKIGCSVKVLEIPNSKDPDEYIRKNGGEKFKKLLSRAISLVEYKVMQLEKHTRLDSLDNKVKFLNSVADVLAGIDNLVEQEMYIERIAKEYKISIDSLKTEILKKKQKNNYGHRNKKIFSHKVSLKDREVKKKAGLKAEHCEKLLLALVAQESSVFDLLKENMEWTDFTSEKNREIARIFYGLLESDTAPVLSEFLSKLRPSDASEMLGIINNECNFEDTREAMLDLLKNLRLINLENKKKEIINKLKNNNHIDKKAKDELNRELYKIIKEIALKKT